MVVTGHTLTHCLASGLLHKLWVVLPNPRQAQNPENKFQINHPYNFSIEVLSGDLILLGVSPCLFVWVVILRVSQAQCQSIDQENSSQITTLSTDRIKQIASEN